MIYALLIATIFVLLFLLLSKKGSCNSFSIAEKGICPEENLKKIHTTVEIADGEMLDIDIFSENIKPPLIWKDRDRKIIWEVKNRDNFDEKFTYDEALKYIDKLNREHYGGYRNWRLPTIDELLTLGNIKLFDYREPKSCYAERGLWIKRNSDKRVGSRFVRKPFSIIMNNQIQSWYWSSTPYEKEIESAWVIDFFEGGNFHNCKKDQNLVMAIRNGEF
jgi:hypothetical protein